MKGFLILNTGTPASPHPKDVGKFIGDMLSDGKVMDVPQPFRHVLARWIIAPLRRKNSAQNYRQIWDYEHQASPLVWNARQLCKQLEVRHKCVAEYAFRYGNPDVAEAITRLEKRLPRMSELVVVHLFPHFAQSSYQTAVDEVTKFYNKQPRSYALRVLPPYYNHPAFIDALSKRISPFLSIHYDRLIFSYHSLPHTHLQREKGRGTEYDYVYQAEETLRLVGEKLNVPPPKRGVVYSSAMGKKWQQPFLDDVIEQLPQQGCKRVIVVCAGFPADNLESLFDIGVKARQSFLACGGEDLVFVPGLNSEDFWVDALWQIACGE